MEKTLKCIIDNRKYHFEYDISGFQYYENIAIVDDSVLEASHVKFTIHGDLSQMTEYVREFSESVTGRMHNIEDLDVNLKIAYEDTALREYHARLDVINLENGLTEFEIIRQKSEHGNQ